MGIGTELDKKTDRQTEDVTVLIHGKNTSYFLPSASLSLYTYIQIEAPQDGAYFDFLLKYGPYLPNINIHQSLPSKKKNRTLSIQ